MRIIFVVFFVFFQASTVEAAKVTSGEHVNFSRLVFAFSKTTQWSIVGAGRSYSIVFLSNDRIDVGHVFEKIPKTRIKKVSVSAFGAIVDIELNCDCILNAYDEEGGIVIVDVSYSVSEIASTYPYNMPRIDTYRRAGLASFENRVAEVEFFDDGPSVVGIYKGINKELSSAASSGVVSLSPSYGDEKYDFGFSTDFDIMPSQINFEMISEDYVGVSKCEVGEIFDIQSWGGRNNFLYAIRKVDRDLAAAYGLGGALDALKFLRLYIYHGMPDEALLAMGDDGVTDYPEIYLIGNVLAGSEGFEHKFENMENCDSPVAMWSILAKGKLRKSESVNVRAIENAFLMLPKDLQLKVGDRLVGKLLQTGYAAAADSISFALRRVNGEKTMSSIYSGAMVESEKGNAEGALDGFKTTVELSRDFELQALIKSVKARVDVGTEIDEKTVMALQSLIGLNGGPNFDQEAMVALAISLTANGRMEEALEIVEDFPSAQGYFWSFASDRASDADMLTFSVSLPSENISKLDAKTQNKISERLYSLGFFNAAANWANYAYKKDEQNKIYKRNLARANLRNGNVATALRLISGEFDPESYAMRAEAYAALDIIPESGEGFESNGHNSNTAMDSSSSWGLVSAETISSGVANSSTAASFAMVDQVLTDARETISMVEKTIQSQEP